MSLSLHSSPFTCCSPHQLEIFRECTIGQIFITSCWRRWLWRIKSFDAKERESIGEETMCADHPLYGWHVWCWLSRLSLLASVSGTSNATRTLVWISPQKVGGGVGWWDVEESGRGAIWPLKAGGRGGGQEAAEIWNPANICFRFLNPPTVRILPLLYGQLQLKPSTIRITGEGNINALKNLKTPCNAMQEVQICQHLKGRSGL